MFQNKKYFTEYIKIYVKDDIILIVRIKFCNIQKI